MRILVRCDGCDWVWVRLWVVVSCFWYHCVVWPDGRAWFGGVSVKDYRDMSDAELAVWALERGVDGLSGDEWEFVWNRLDDIFSKPSRLDYREGFWENQGSGRHSQGGLPAVWPGDDGHLG